MQFMNNYPTSKTAQEEEMEIKIKLESLIRKAMKRTAETRTEGLKLTDEQIENVVSKIRELKFDRSQNLTVISLEGIIDKALEGSNDPEIMLIKSQQSAIYRNKQQKFEQSEEYMVAQEMLKKHPNIAGKIMKAFDIGAAHKREDGTIKINISCDEARLISSKYDNAAVCIKNGIITIETEESDKSEKSLSDK